MRLNAFSTKQKQNKLLLIHIHQKRLGYNSKGIQSHFDWIVDDETIEGRAHAFQTMHMIIIHMKIQQLKIVSKCNGHDIHFQNFQTGLRVGC